MSLMQRKNIKKMIQNGEMVVGLTCQILDPVVAEIAGIAGFDYIRLEGEHLRPDWSDIRNYVLAADSVGIPLIMRLNDLDDITAINDLGVAGYQIPHVQNAEQARTIVERIRYKPHGMRGFSRYVRAQKYGYTSFDEYQKSPEADLLLIVQIEDAEGIRNMEEIIATDGIDVICSGKGDISQALNILGDMKNDKVREVEEQIISLAKKYNKKLMILGRDREDWIHLVSNDCCTITEHVCDIEILLNGALHARQDMEFLKENKVSGLSRTDASIIK